MKKVLVLTFVLFTIFSFGYVKNVILLIGDGMGLSQVYLTQLAEGRPLEMTKTPYIGLVTTYSANTWVTDSAAAGTALAAGFKTNNGMIGMLPNGERVPTIAEILKMYGVKVGIISTSRITHATPASFYGHVNNRDLENDLAEQLSKSNFDVILGAGYGNFLPKSLGGKRTDDKNLIANMVAQGYTYTNKRSELATLDGKKVIGLFASSHLAPVANRPSDQPTLDEMTSKALELLSKDGTPFFLMVEGSQIDWEAHGNDPYGVWKETVEFDNAVKVALEFARKNPDTLILVTGDHETGGLSIASKTYMIDIEKLREYKMDTDTFMNKFPIDNKKVFIEAVKENYGIEMTDQEYAALLSKKGNPTDLVNSFGRYISDKAQIGWTSFEHTGVPVPIYAFGPGAENFTGWFDNTEIPRTIARLMGYPLTYPIQKEPIITGSINY
ncbi:MAG TPA: alkaline phosphatase [Fervidobacterium sp.]|nr:alkaline phosphatase [Fervidobacterium sp.]